MMPLGAPSISKYGSLVRPDAQIVALRVHCARTARALRLRLPQYLWPFISVYFVYSIACKCGVILAGFYIHALHAPTHPCVLNVSFLLCTHKHTTTNTKEEQLQLFGRIMVETDGPRPASKSSNAIYFVW